MKIPGNEKLFAARVSAGLFSQSAAAIAVSEAGKKALRNPDFEIDVRTWRRWESKTPGWPRSDQATAIRALFGRGPQDLGFTVPGGVEFDAPPGRGDIIAPVKRRDALTAGAALLAMPWLSSAASTASYAADTRVGRDEIVELQAVTDDLQAIDQQFGGDRLWRVARSHLMRIHQLIDNGVYAEDIGVELHGIAGQLTTSLGWFCYDAERHLEGRMYFSEALNTAMLSGDGSLAARTLSNMARQSIDLGKPREAIRFAQKAAANLTSELATPRVMALLLVRKAQGYAAMGDEIAYKTAITQAWRHFDRGVSDGDPDWTAFLNEAEMVCLEGMCRLDLNQHRVAVRLLDRSSRLQEVARSRNRGMCLARLSLAAVQDQDLDRAIVTTGESLRLIEGGGNSARNRTQLARVRDGLGAFGGNLQAQETIELIDQHIRQPA